MDAVSFRREGLSVVTAGLPSRGQSEMRAAVAREDQLSGAQDLLAFVVDYMTRSGRHISSDETLAYGYWLLKFSSRAGQELHVLELTPDGSRFVDGCGSAVGYWGAQRRICAEAAAQFVPPRADRLAAISKGVMEGASVFGVRYRAPEHMSGWYLTTDEYDGDPSTLRTEHLYHVTSKRPELAKFLALPPGYRFDTSPQDRIWFDQAVADADE
jgi:hypothetical protein